ncbi:MAG TPA: sigma-70 family RNA polymerase sigma factor [Ilumatobacteraceae bacterium]|jgi:RNA polymerase sigma-70 factor (ECF subfamily)
MTVIRSIPSRDEPDGRSEESDSTLIVRARQGDPSAFDELVRRHAAIAVRAARSFGGLDEVDEIVQDAFVKAHRALARFDLERPFRPWLVAFVANESRHRRRGRMRRERLNESVGANRGAVESSAEDTTMQSMDRARLRSALTRLDRKDRDVIVYRYLLEFSEAETADALQCPVGTVKSRSSRALARLRGTLGEVRSDG